MGDIEKDPCHNPPNLNINRPKFQLPTSEKPPRLSQPAVNIRGREGLYHITQRNPTTCEYPSGTTSTRWLKTPSMYHISAYCGASFILMSCFPDMEPTTGLWRFCEVCVATFPCVSVFWLVGWLVGWLLGWPGPGLFPTPTVTAKTVRWARLGRSPGVEKHSEMVFHQGYNQDSWKRFIEFALVPSPFEGNWRIDINNKLLWRRWKFT